MPKDSTIIGKSFATFFNKPIGLGASSSEDTEITGELLFSFDFFSKEEIVFSSLITNLSVDALGPTPILLTMCSAIDSANFSTIGSWLGIPPNTYTQRLENRVPSIEIVCPSTKRQSSTTFLYRSI